MTGYDADHPLTADDARVLTLLAEAQDAHDPMPPGLLERISLAVSLELMEAELAVLTAEALEPARADTPNGRLRRPRSPPSRRGGTSSVGPVPVTSWHRSSPSISAVGPGASDASSRP